MASAVPNAKTARQNSPKNRLDPIKTGTYKPMRDALTDFAHPLLISALRLKLRKTYTKSAKDAPIDRMTQGAIPRRTWNCAQGFFFTGRWDVDDDKSRARSKRLRQSHLKSRGMTPMA
ncbi:MAG: hypothetical protein CMJ19_20650 [Phycisphaeraceae bacterium]|nr:hypothetical protein [Phycisphaeraceae bacterium]